MHAPVPPSPKPAHTHSAHGIASSAWGLASESSAHNRVDFIPRTPFLHLRGIGGVPQAKQRVRAGDIASSKQGPIDGSMDLRAPHSAWPVAPSLGTGLLASSLCFYPALPTAFPTPPDHKAYHPSYPPSYRQPTRTPILASQP